MSKLFVENFLSHSAGKFPVAKKFMEKMGGISRVSVESFLSHSAKTCRRATL